MFRWESGGIRAVSFAWGNVSGEKGITMATMTSKERILTALRREEPDRVPTGENQVAGPMAEEILGRPTLYNGGMRELEALWSGRREEVVREYGDALVGLVRGLEWDYVRVPFVPAAQANRRPRMTGPHSWIDDDGQEVHFYPNSGSITERSHYPEMTTSDLPDPDEPWSIDVSQLDAMRRVVRELGDTHFIIARPPLDGTFPWGLTVGMEEFLVRMITDPDFVNRSISAYVNRSIVQFKAILETGVDAIMTTDDYSDNRGPIMGKELFRKFILPGIERQCRAIHDLGGIFIKHTDGNVWDILDDLVGAGIDGWHGIQREIGMDMKRLKSAYGKRLCFFGGVNCETLITGLEEEIREEVRTAIEEAGPGGGLVVTASNVVPPGSKIENYRAMRQAIRDYGRYPIRVSRFS
jgi:uroporphyrinogen decarboxylase